MDNPNVNLRRRHSHAGSRGSSLLLRMSYTSNPYVGTFRHSPATSTFSKQSAAWRSHNLQTSCYSSKLFLGGKNNKNSCPTSHDVIPLSRSLLEVVYRLLFCQDSCNKLPEKCNGLFRLQDLLNGHLRGGGEGIVDWPLFQRTLRRQSTQSSSSTVQVLSRLAYWLLLPFQETPIKSPYDTIDETSSNLTDSHYYDTDADDDDDDDDTSSILSSIQGSDFEYGYGSSSVVSSQAEAYYAHQATSSLTNHKDSLLLAPSAHDYRLDYTITQMDVMRMIRNASRHLDVESIVQLPVYTYCTTPPPPPTTNETRNPEEQQQEQEEVCQQDMSWLLVQNNEETGVQEGSVPDDVIPSASNRNNDNTNNNDDDVCVICLEHFCHGDRLRVLPCHHSFHVGCIDRWLSGSHSFDDCVTSGCPTCKKRPDVNTATTINNEAAAQTQQQQQQCTNDGSSVPAWAFTQIGSILSRPSN